MTGSKPSSEEVFEIDRIRQLVELMEQHGLSEIDLRRQNQRIRLRRGTAEEETATPPAPASSPSGVPTAICPASPALR